MADVSILQNGKKYWILRLFSPFLGFDFVGSLVTTRTNAMFILIFYLNFQVDECKIWACWSYKGPGGLLLRRWAQHYIVSLFNNLDFFLYLLCCLIYGVFQNTCKSFIFSPAFQWAILTWKQHLVLTLTDHFRMFSKGYVEIRGWFCSVCERLCSICMKLLLKMYFMLFEKLF